MFLRLVGCSALLKFKCLKFSYMDDLNSITDTVVSLIPIREKRAALCERALSSI